MIEAMLEKVKDVEKSCCRTTSYVIESEVAQEFARLKTIKVEQVMNISQDSFG